MLFLWNKLTQNVPINVLICQWLLAPDGFFVGKAELPRRGKICITPKPRSEAKFLGEVEGNIYILNPVVGCIATTR